VSSARSVLFVIRGTRPRVLLRPILLIDGRGACGFEAVSIEDRTWVKSDSETARMTPQLLRASLLPDGTRDLDGDEREEARFLLEHLIPAKTALNCHSDHLSRTALPSPSHNTDRPHRRNRRYPTRSRYTARSSRRLTRRRARSVQPRPRLAPGALGVIDVRSSYAASFSLASWSPAIRPGVARRQRRRG
jgi:hypothetical protein